MTKKPPTPIEEIVKRDPILAFEGEYRFLSNFYDGIIDLKGKMFASAEHAFQCCKTRDPVWQKDIQRARSPMQARRLGRECPLREDWETIKVTIMRHVIAAKFPEVGALSEKLHHTSTAVLVEGNDHGDRFWGAIWVPRWSLEPGAMLPWAERPGEGGGTDVLVGENMLGKLLMERRTQLFNSIPF